MRIKPSILWTILLCKAALLFLFILWGPLRLGPDEAQYWTWSERLDIGYFSKPPGIAYQIKAGTLLFGNSELGVRFLSLVIGTLQPWLIYLLAYSISKEQEKALFAAIAWALSPLGMIGSFLAITDVGMIFFLTGALLFYQREGVSWKTGLMIGLGALFKWPIYLFWFWVLMEELANKRRMVFSPILISLLGIVPSLVWGLSHEGATFRHVGATVLGGGDHRDSWNPLAFFLAQIALVSPLFFYSMARAISWKGFFARSFGLSIIGAIVLSFFMKLQGNWAVFIYPLGFVLLQMELNKKRLLWGSILSLLLLGSVFFLPYKSSPFKYNLGVDNIEAALSKAGFQKGDFISAGSYQLVSQASFYNPLQEIGYFVNLDGRRQNQFSFWPSLGENSGRSGWFLSYEKGEEVRLTHFFENVLSPQIYNLYKGKKWLYLYKVSGPRKVESDFPKHY